MCFPENISISAFLKVIQQLFIDQVLCAFTGNKALEKNKRHGVYILVG